MGQVRAIGARLEPAGGRPGTAWILVLVLMAAPALFLSGCARHRWLEVGSGTYTQVQKSDGTSQVAARQLQSLTVDREADTLTLAFDAGSPMTLPFTARDRDRWPSGCPTNLFHHYLEVLDLDADTATIGDLVLSDPILVRNCPGRPEQVVLREDGRVGGAGDAVDAPYLIFTR